MKATSVKLPDAEVLLTVEASPEDMAQARETAYRSLAPRVPVPGFRPGRAPRAMIEQHIGQARLLNEALEGLLPSLYRMAVEQESIHPYSEGEVEVTQRDPLIFKIRMPLVPTVSLGDYRSIRLAKQAVNVEDSEIDEVIEGIREENAEWVPPPEPRAVQLGDRVVMDLTGSAGGETFVQRAGLDVLISEERSLVVPGLASEAVGMMAEEERQVSLPVPETFSVERLRGQSAEFVFKVHEIKEKRLPAVDDEFAQTAGQAEGVADLRRRVEETLRARKETQERDRYEDDLISAVAASSQIEYPIVMVDEEIERMVEVSASRLRANGIDLETYLRMSHKSMGDYRAELTPEAHRRIRTGLVVSEVARAEGISADSAEIDLEIERLTLGSRDQPEATRKQLQSERGRRNVAAMLVERKALARLVDIAAGGGDAGSGPGPESAVNAAANQT